MELTPEERRHILEGALVRAERLQARAWLRFKEADTHSQETFGLVHRYWDWVAVRAMKKFYAQEKVVANAEAHLAHDPRFGAPLYRAP